MQHFSYSSLSHFVALISCRYVKLYPGTFCAVSLNNASWKLKLKRKRLSIDASVLFSICWIRKDFIYPRTLGKASFSDIMKYL